MGFTYVNSGGAESGVAASASYDPGWTVAAGDLVVLAVWWYQTSAITGTPSDNSGDGAPWNTLGQGSVNYPTNNYLSGAIYWKVMGAGGAVRFTVTNSAPAYTSLVALEYTPSGTVAGDGWATPLLTQDAAAGTYSGHSLTTTGTSDLVLSFINDATGGRTHAAATGYTLRVDLTNGADEPGAAEDQLGVAAGTITPSWSLGSCSGTGSFAIFGGALTVAASADGSGAIALGPLAASGSGFAGAFATAPVTMGRLRAPGVGSFSTSAGGAYPWYDPAWAYRLPLAVTNGSATSALSCYQHGIALTGAAYNALVAHAKPDLSDLRLTDSDGVTPLSFALEYLDSTNSAAYLLAKLSCPASTSKTIYAYYGNPAATSVASFAATVGPTTTPAAVDVFNQANSAGYNNTPTIIRLRHQDQAHGGGAALNGRLLCFADTGTDNASSGGVLKVAASTTDGASWGAPTTLLTPAAGSAAQWRGGPTELPDGTIIGCYEYNTNALATAGTPTMYFCKSVDGGTTWTNLSTSPTNAAPPIYSDTAWGQAGYGAFLPQSDGDIWLTWYGKNTGQTASAAGIIECPSGSDPTVGSNWTKLADIAYDGAVYYSETSVCRSPDGSHWIAVARNDATSGASLNGDLYLITSTDATGAAWNTPVRMGLVAGNDTNRATSPYLLALPSGNILLLFGVRYGTTWGVGARLSTDGGTTWDDRPTAMIAGYASSGTPTATSFGYPWADTLADGNICAVWYYENAGYSNADAVNVGSLVFGEDLAANAGNVWDSCQTTSTWTSVGANVAADGTHALPAVGSLALKFDNSAGTGAVASRPAWTPGYTAPSGKAAYSLWEYTTQMASTQAHSMDLLDPSADRRVLTYVDASLSPAYQLAWYDGTTEHGTGVVAPLNSWNKLTVRAALAASSASGGIDRDDASATSALTGYQPGSMAGTFRLTAGTTTAPSATTAWLGAFYAHQYAATLPTTTVGAETSRAAPVALAPLVVSGSAFAGSFATASVMVAPLSAPGVGTFAATVAASAALGPLASPGSGSSGSSATGLVTLATLAAPGSAAFSTTATASAALAPLASPGVGTTLDAGSAAVGLGPVATAGVAFPGSFATAPVSMAPVASPGVGTFAATASAAIALGPPIAPAVGTFAATASASAGLAPLAPAGSGFSGSTASAAATLAPLAAASVGTASTAGSAAASLGALVPAASGTFTATASAGTGLAPVAAAGTGPSGSTAAGAPTLAPLASPGSGIFAAAATGAPALNPPAVVAAGTFAAAGSGLATLAPAVAPGSASSGAAAAGSPSLGGLAGSGIGPTAITAAAGIALAPILAPATATFATPAAAAPILAPLAGPGSSIAGAIASPAIVLGGLTPAASATFATPGSGVVVLSPLATSGVAAARGPAAPVDPQHVRVIRARGNAPADIIDHRNVSVIAGAEIVGSAASIAAHQQSNPSTAADPAGEAIDFSFSTLAALK